MTETDTRPTTDDTTTDDVRHLFDPYAPDLPAPGEVGTALCGERVRRPEATTVYRPGTSDLRPDQCPICAMIHAEG